MKILLIRLDDACPRRDIAKWDRMESLLDKYNVKPLVGIIPDCKDPALEKYPLDEKFWAERILQWKEKGWSFAMHGYDRDWSSDVCSSDLSSLQPTPLTQTQ